MVYYKNYPEQTFCNMDRVELNIEVLDIPDMFLLADEKNDPRQEILSGVIYDYGCYSFYLCAHYTYSI